MDHDALVAAAHRVAYFGDVQLFGQRQTVRGLSVLWHAHNRQWLVDIPGYAGGVARPEVLRKFAEGALATLQTGTGDYESTVFADDYVRIEVTVGFDEDGLSLIVWAWFDPKRDFVGVSPLGEPLYRSAIGSAYLELYVEQANRQTLITSFRTLLDHLSTNVTSDGEPPESANVVATFAKRASDPSKTRLDIAHRQSDDQWLVTLYPALTRPATSDAIRALAEAARAVIDTRDGDRTIPLLVEDGYRMDITIGPDADAFHVTAAVHSPAEDGTEHTLSVDARFAPVSEAQLKAMITELS